MKKLKHLSWFMLIPLAVGGLVACADQPSNSSDDYSESSESENLPSAEVVNETTVTTYGGPSIMDTSTQCKIEVNGKELFVYETKVNHKRVFSWTNEYSMAPYAYFDFKGSVNVKITLPETVTKAKVSPLGYNIEPKAGGNVIEFTINQPDTYIIEPNGDYKKAITLIANPLETNAPDKNDPNVIYLAPGCYDAGAIPLSKGKTLYLAGGAYVFGQIRAEKQDNITIRGRGVLSGETLTRNGEGDAHCPMELRFCKNVNIEGVILADPAGWATAIYGCDGVKANNVKIISARPNGDGWSIQGSKNVLVENGFVRTWDDSLVVKCNDNLPTENITFKGVNVWTDLAQSMEVGFEANGDYMKNVTFKDINVVHAFHKAPISIHNADRAKTSNIKYENITVEHGEMYGDSKTDNESDFLIDFAILYHQDWSKNPNLGDVEKVTVRNVNFVDVPDTCITRIAGDKTSKATINEVLFDRIKINGKNVTDETSLKITKGDNVGNVTVRTGEVTGARIKNVYDTTNIGDKVNFIENKTVPQDAILVPDFATLKGDLQYLGEPIDYKVQSISVTHGKGNKFNDPYDDGTGDYASSELPAANLYDKDDTTLFQSKPYLGEENEFFALTIRFSEPIFLGNMRLFGATDNHYSYQYDINTRYIAKEGGNFRNAVAKTTYKISPTGGNCIDIAMSANMAYAIQFRIYPAKDEFFAINKLSFGELKLYGPSLSYNKPVLDATQHSDVYTADRLTDGNPGGTSYYEAKTFPASFVIDLGDVYNVKVISLNLPANLMWDVRNQEIQLDCSADNSPYNKQTTTFTSLVEKTRYTFDPQSGNKNVITLDTPASMRFLKVTIFSNDSPGGYGAQLSEVYVFGSK